MIKSISILLLLSSIAASPLVACDDPCPNVKLGFDFQQTALTRWIKDREPAPLWKGVSSYHVSEAEAHYTTFVADLSGVLVGEAECALFHSDWVFLNWEKVDDKEFKTISVLESYYQGISPILELKKARYGQSLIVYLLKTEFRGKIDWIFELYTSAEAGALRSLGGAYAYPLVPIKEK